MKNWLWVVELEDENFERVCAVDWDSLPIYDVYFDDSDLEVSTSIHIEETIQESDNKCSMQVKSSFGHERFANTFFDWVGLQTHFDFNKPLLFNEIPKRIS